VTRNGGVVSRRIGSAIVAIAFSATPVFAICPEPTPKVCSSFFESDVVFVGTVVSKASTDVGEYLAFRFRVSEVLRGAAGPTTLVHSGNDSGRAPWEVGQRYVVFAQRADGAPAFRWRLWATV
jgi:hypothetical protein